MHSPTRFAFIHPIWLSTAGIAYFIVVAAGTPTMNAIIVPLFWAAMILVLLMWAHGIYHATRRVDGISTQSREWVFVTAEWAVVPLTALMFASGKFAPHPVMALLEGLGTLSGLVLFFTSLWLGAASLSRHQKATLQSSTAHKIGYFLAMVYWIIGAWFLWPKLRRLRTELSNLPARA